MRAFGVLLFAYLFSQFFRSFLSIIAVDLTRDLGYGPAELGWISSSWFAAFALAQFPVGYLLDTVGPRRTLLATMLAGVAGGLLFAFATSLPFSLLGMALIGVGCAPILMATLYIFGRTERPERFAVLASLFIGFGNIGNLAAAAPLAYAAHQFGWRASMASVGLLMSLAVLVIALFLKDPPKAAPRTDKVSFLGDIRTIVTLPALWMVFPLHLVSYAAIATERGLWVGPFLKVVHGFDALQIGTLALSLSIGMALGAIFSGPLAPRLGGLKRASIFFNVLAILLFLTLAWMPKGHSLLAAVFGLLGFFGMSYSLLLSHGRPFFPDHLLGRGVTFLNFLSIGGAGLMQAVTGQIMERLLQVHPAPTAYAMLHVGMALTVLAALVLFSFAPVKPRA
jgi:MFS family permease